MRSKLIGLALFVSVILVACGSNGSPPACASTLSVNQIAAQHGVLTTAYVTRGGGGSSGGHSSSGGSHSSSGSSHSPSNSGSHSSSGSPSKSGSHSSVSGSRSSTYKGPVKVSHSSYTYKGSGGVTHVYVHHTTSYYHGYSANYAWARGASINYDPYNPWNYYNPYSPYFQVRLASC